VSSAGLHTKPVAAFVDLDRTLIYSRTAALLNGGPGPDLVCVEHYEGEPLSYVTAMASGLIAGLAGTGALVPVTTRTIAQLGRVRLPGRPAPLAICTNGATILQAGVPDEHWAAAVRAAVASTSAPLAEVVEGMAGLLRAEWTLSRRVADDIFCYSVVDRARMPAGVVEELTAWTAERGWTVSVQGRKVYAVPTTLDKASAAAEVARRLGAGRTLAAGDSLLDRSMLAWADEAIRPDHGELAAVGWRAPRLSVTTARGILAGEEIARWLTPRLVASWEC